MTTSQRTIVAIDPAKCNGCGLCVDACHEGAIQMRNGKAYLVSDIYCDGLGDCLGPCPTGAITLITRQAEEYDADAVARRTGLTRQNIAASPGLGCPGMLATSVKKPAPNRTPASLPCGCPGNMSQTLTKPQALTLENGVANEPAVSELMNWPVQLRLVPPEAPYLLNADLLLAADCAAAAVPDFHARYLKGKPLLIACPKFDDSEPQIAKLAEILTAARPASLTILRMEVPCCGGLTRIVEQAIQRSGVHVPLAISVVGADGTEK